MRKIATETGSMETAATVRRVAHNKSRTHTINEPEENIVRGEGLSLLPKLTVNRQFMGEFLSADAPCFALGMVEERKRRCGFLALRPEEAIPPDVTSAGFSFGHCLFGNAAFEAIQFSFHFYGFKTYNELVNPNNPIMQTVLPTMIESGDYFFFALGAEERATAFRSEIGETNLCGLETNLPRIRRSTTTEAQYRHAILIAAAAQALIFRRRLTGRVAARPARSPRASDFALPQQSARNRHGESRWGMSRMFQILHDFPEPLRRAGSGKRRLVAKENRARQPGGREGQSRFAGR